MGASSIGNYYVGLDIGTNSVGWAVTDQLYNLIRRRGHRMLGSRLFDEGETAQKRGTKRRSIRRNNRKKDRLAILEELFAEEIYKVDPAFFQRLKESRYYKEDKSDNVTGRYFLFNDKGFTDKDYNKQYPTIYHLRNELLNKPAEDIRLLFLAIHHILKKRGHFLLADQNIKTQGNMASNLKELFRQEDINLSSYTSDKFIGQLITILIDKNINRKDKAKKFVESFDDSSLNKKHLNAVASIVLGLKTQLDDLFLSTNFEEIDKDKKTITLESNSKTYEEILEPYELLLGDRISVLDICESLYQGILLSKIKPDGKYLSESKVDEYKKHKDHLKEFKAFIKAQNKELYYEMFFNRNNECKTSDDYKKKKLVEPNKDNYAAYINGSTNKENFHNYVKAVLKTLDDSVEKEYFLQLIELDDFLPKQKVRENGVIPYQVHLEELEKIIDVSVTKYPFLKTVDDTGLSVGEKIVSLMTFRIPYYVGPLNPNGGSHGNKFAWVVRKQPGKVVPWNFNEKIDIHKSAEAFIQKMTNKCTYLLGEDVLPKNSLLYSRFMLLNEINNIKYNGAPLPNDIKKSLINEKFETNHEVMTVKRLLEFIKSKLGKDAKGVITGLDGEIKSDIKSYRDMVSILGEGFDKAFAEEVIRYITLFGEAKNVLKDALKDLQSRTNIKLGASQEKKLLELKYKDWGRLSKRLLVNIYGELKGKTNSNIINCMEEYPVNLMEVLSSQNSFINEIEKFNKEIGEDVPDNKNELVDSLMVSPAVKCSVGQTLRVLEEIVELQGSAPKRIFVEVTRTNQAPKKNTTSRQKYLLNLYDNKDLHLADLKAEIEQRNSGDFLSKAIFLYFLQQGKSMYSDTPIDFERLDSGAYEIDYIHPRCIKRDNSFDNLVLVLKKENQDKGDNYPLKENIRVKQEEFWRYLLKYGFISDSKFERLTRAEPLTGDDLNSFINRQLVETSQSIKQAISLIKRLYPDTEVCYVKAENVSDFRQRMKLLKMRNLNHFHHAHDAYLNIVVGNVYYERFTKNPINFINRESNDNKWPYSLNTLFDKKIKGGQVWDPDRDKATVQKMLNIPDVQVTRKTEEKTGALYHEKLVPKNEKKADDYAPIKLNHPILSNVAKYGGYDSIQNAFFAIVKGKKKNGKEEVHLIAVPIYMRSQILTDDDLIRYASQKFATKKFVELVVLYDKIYEKTLMRINGNYYFFGGKTGNSFYIWSAQEVVLNKFSCIVLNRVEKHLARLKINADYIANPKFLKQTLLKYLYKRLVNKMGSPMFKNLKGNKYLKLSEPATYQKFKELTIDEQCKTIIDILNIIILTRGPLSIASLDVKQFKPNITMNLTNLDEFVIINQSVTGLYRNEIKII